MADLNETNKNNPQNSLDKVGITINDEPTRFLTKEEMEELDGAIFTNAKESTSSNINNDNFKVVDEFIAEGRQEVDKDECKEENSSKSKESKIKIEELKIEPAKKVKSHTMRFPKFSLGSSAKEENYHEVEKKHKLGLWGKIARFIKRLLFVLAFILAAIFGFYLAFTWNTHKESNHNAREHNVQQLEVKERDLDNQKQELEQQKLELEQQKEKLNAQREELTKEKSFIIKVVDTLTGKDEEDKNRVNELKKSIDKAQSIIDEVDSQLVDLDKVKEEVSDLKSTAQEQLKENQDIKDTVNTIQHQVKLFLNKFL